jgi:hypothetical protein
LGVLFLDRICVSFMRLRCREALNVVSCDFLHNSDKKVHARQFMLQNAAATHIFHDVVSQIEGHGACAVHPTSTCAIPVTKELLDLLVIGFACQPFSRRRHKRFCLEGGYLHQHEPSSQLALDIAIASFIRSFIEH